MHACAIIIALAVCTRLFSEEVDASVTSAATKPSWNETNLDRLKKDLLMNYDKYARPQEHYNVTELRIGMGISHLETDERKSTLTAQAMLRLIWTDSKLTWNESNYGGINVARIGDHEIWQPDLYLHNSISGGDPLTRYSNPNVLIYPNGEVLFVPPTKLTALCEFDLRYWPFDTQNCRFTIGSWTHNRNEIKLLLYNNSPHVSIESQMNWSAWAVLNTSIEIETKYYFDCCREPSYLANFNFVMARKHGPYKSIVVTPAIVLALLIMMQFWLQPQAEERLILNGFLVVTIVMFLIYFSTAVSVAGSNTPLLVMFYAGSLCMLCLSMVANVVALAFARIKPTQSLPWAVRKQFNGVLGKILMLNFSFGEIDIFAETTKDQPPKNNQAFGFGNGDYAITKHTSQKRRRQDLVLAVVIDRVLFIIYSTAYAILLAVYLC